MSEFGQAPSPTNHRDHNHQSNHPHLIIITSPSQAVFKHTPHHGTLSGLNFEKDSLTWPTYLHATLFLRLSWSSVSPASSSTGLHPTPTYPPKCVLDCSAPNLQRLRTVSTPIQYYHPPHSTLLTSLFIIPASITLIGFITVFPPISWCVVGVLAQYGCRRIIQVDAAQWWWMRRFQYILNIK